MEEIATAFYKSLAMTICGVRQRRPQWHYGAGDCHASLAMT